MAIKKQIAIKWMLTTLWVCIGAGTLVLLVAAVQKKNTQRCKGVNITIKDVQNNCFVDKKDILDSLKVLEGEDPVGKGISSFDLQIMETKLKKNVWVKKAELFFDNNDVLQIKITEREPVARIFANNETTFYIDTSNAILPLSEKFSARLPVFTGFPTDKARSKADSNLLKDIQTISLALQQNAFCMAMIDQVDITPQKTFDMVPKIGNTTIVFGDATDAAEKLRKLKVFYQQVMPQAGWNYYSQVNVQYKNEIVAKKRGADDKSVDSLHTIQMMQQIAANAERAANDSLQTFAADNENNTTDENLIQQSMQRDDEESNGAQLPSAWVPKPVEIKPTPVEKPKSAPVEKPKPATVTKPAVKAVVKPKSTNPKPVKTTPPVIKDKAADTKPYTQQPKTTISNPKPVDKPKPAATNKPMIKEPKKQTTKPNNDY
ncbi:FtsQ-type POTRA domain-containing protein [Ferruginibacter albus]|uniref:FtsQ-type POTRA domain-containing protein n=1 Tax=Ferruginibacter albus TaxID=2875540 RepID=UPI001CC79850|nr:FtsQ-type POTRA domain-containing protein [Ferruginibacter albus]UAY51641.1 FtsQ-type POTRA domain-containing protein [Ferruginibacter albus]